MSSEKTFQDKHSRIKLNGDLISRNRWLIPLGLVTLYFIVFSILQPEVFLSPYNLKYLLLEFSIPVLVTIGMAVQLIGGEIDLSVANNVMFSNIFCGVMIMRAFPVPAAIAITLISTLVVGYLAGLVVARIGVNSFIASLGFGQIYYSLGLALYSYGSNRKNFLIPKVDLLHMSAEFKTLGQTELWGLQLPVYYALIIIVFFIAVFSRTKYFRKYYFIGANKEAARLSGIKVESMKTMAFVISAFMSGLAGVIYAARMGVCSVTFGVNLEMKAIAGCVIGGVSMQGGKGTVLGAVLGSLFLICVNNGMRLTNVSSNYYRIVEGGILLLAVIIDTRISMRKQKT